MVKTLRNITTREIRLAVKIFIVLWFFISLNAFLEFEIADANESDFFICFLIIAMFAILTELIIKLFDYTAKALDKESLYSLGLKAEIIKLQLALKEHIEKEDQD